MHFHLTPRGAARTGYINRCDPGPREAAAIFFGKSPTDFLGNHGDAVGGKTFTDGFDFCEQSGEVSVAFGLDSLLNGIEVQNQRIGANDFYNPTTLIYAVAIIKLHGSAVRKQQNIG